MDGKISILFLSKKEKKTHKTSYMHTDSNQFDSGAINKFNTESIKQTHKSKLQIFCDCIFFDCFHFCQHEMMFKTAANAEN